MAASSKTTDPESIRELLQELLASGEEFPIKVEGTKTLPYSALLIPAETAPGEIVVKLVRPLPPALAAGAPFEMVFPAKGKRYETRIFYEERVGYLQYRFQGPSSLVASDRRVWKRYPIRPREDFHVTAQDAGFPGHGFTGPLVNLSMGGLAFRVDRMLRVEDGMPIRPGGHLVDQGMVFSFLRVRGFPKGQILDARGTVMRVQEAHSELLLCVQFTGLEESSRRLLSSFLETREMQSRGSGSGRVEMPGGATPRGKRGEAASHVEEALPPPVAPETAGLEALLRLDRRSTCLLLVSPPGEDRDRIFLRLQAEGYWRVETASDLFVAHARWKEAAESPIQLLLVDLEPHRTEGLEPVGAVRHMEPLLRSFGQLPTAFITRLPDPMLELLERPGFGSLAQETSDPAAWGRILDGLAPLH